MNKTNGLLFAALLSVSIPCLPFGQEASQGYQVQGSGYPASQGYQVDGYHHHHGHNQISSADQRQLDSYQKEIDEFIKENENAYREANKYWWATGAAVTGTLASLAFKSSHGAYVCGAATLAAGGMGLYIKNSANSKIAIREAQIKERRQGQEKILEAYRR